MVAPRVSVLTIPIESSCYLIPINLQRAEAPEADLLLPWIPLRVLGEANAAASHSIFERECAQLKEHHIPGCPEIKDGQ